MAGDVTDAVQIDNSSEAKRDGREVSRDTGPRGSCCCSCSIGKSAYAGGAMRRVTVSDLPTVDRAPGFPSQG